MEFHNEQNTTELAIPGACLSPVFEKYMIIDNLKSPKNALKTNSLPFHWNNKESTVAHVI